MRDGLNDTNPSHDVEPMLPALVLTAGLATRLRPLSLVRAKAALPVAGVPLVERIIRTLTSAGLQDLVLNLHHLPQTVTALVGDGAHLGARVRYSWETVLLGSAGGPRRALPIIDGSPFLIVNGDTLTNVNLMALVEAHARSGADVTMAVAPNREPMKYGGVRVGNDGVVTGFTRRGSTEPSCHFIGVQVANAAAFASVPDGVPYESVATLYPAILRERPGAIRAFVSNAECLDIGTPSDYLRTSLLLARREGHEAALAPSLRVGTGATVVDSVLWEGVTVGKGAQLKRCIVTDGVAVPPGSTWSDVTVRVASGTLAPGEIRSGVLAIMPLSVSGNP